MLPAYGAGHIIRVTSIEYILVDTTISYGNFTEKSVAYTPVFTVYINVHIIKYKNNANLALVNDKIE